jgi:hypothetical protein
MRPSQEERDGGGIEPVPQRRVWRARLGQVPLGRCVVGDGREERISAGARQCRLVR